MAQGTPIGFVDPGQSALHRATGYVWLAQTLTHRPASDEGIGAALEKTGAGNTPENIAKVREAVEKYDKM